MDFEEVANQLAKPTGSFGVQVGVEMNRLNQFINENTYDLLDISNSDSILEIGLGNGKFIEQILKDKKNVYYTGIDISETMITEAQKLNNARIKTGFVDLIVAGIEKMPFWEDTFTKICSVNTIYFWNDPIKALHEVYRVLMVDGVFIIAFRPYIEGKSLDFSAYGFREYKTEEVESLIEKTNFEIVEKRSITEPPIDFNGQEHELASEYFILKKTKQ